MRILKLIFYFAVLVIFGGGLFFLGAREVLLSLAVARVQSATRELAVMAKNSGTYAASCRKKGIVELDESSIKALQLRFTSDTNYQTEVVCRQFSLDPIVVKNFSLPQFVQKTPGSGGIVWGETLSGIGLSLWGRSKSVYLDNGIVKTGTPRDILSAVGPVTSCEGQGFTCCQSETTIGVGASLKNVSDCSANCFSSCIKRPVILSFSTQPFYDAKTREVSVVKGEQLSVAYVADLAGSKSLTVTIDFGDGETQTLSSFSGESVHAYSCATSLCRYSLQISAVNERGIEAARTALTEITVVVQ